ncbi:MAG: hypothetical protein HKN41_07720 [Ilumatobacter sp.]|nr:hypothetical protein [Ilumatobacter sp.]
MALLPRALRPKFIIRRKAIRQGVFGQSTFWKAVAVWVFGKASIKKFFGKQPVVIDKASLGRGRYMQVATAKPLTRRQRKKLRGSGAAVPTLKERKELGRLWADAADRERRAS